MAISTKIQPISDWVEIVVDRDLSPKARQEAVAKFARTKLAETQAANTAVLGRAPDYTQTVDGKRGAALETVNPDRGRITFEFEIVTDVLTWIMQTLRDRSPVVSGAYRDGHRLFADGVEVDPANVPAASEYRITNTVEYARRIEIGKTNSGRDFVISVPNRIYERTAKDARARFGNIAKISYIFSSLVGGRTKKAMRYPTIVVVPQ